MSFEKLKVEVARLEAVAAARRVPSDLRRPSDSEVLDALVDVVVALVERMREGGLL